MFAERLAIEATEHMQRMMAPEGVCKVPRAVVVNVQQVYPDPSKTYLPHCTILHRCTDSTGCCRSPFETCRPKASGTRKVELPFYVSTLCTTLLGKKTGWKSVNGLLVFLFHPTNPRVRVWMI